jgi:beta-galactosidase/beta-glucuronidase
LNGLWDFHFDKKAEYATPDKIQWDHRIIVPFSPETTASGIADTGFYVAVWYRRTFQAPKLRDDDCLLLHFEAVDYSTTVWINGSKVCEHEGGYTPFTIEITQVLKTGAPQEIVVRAEDDPADLAKPRGKQDWCLEPHSIWYPRTTGIWQPVWLEIVPRRRIETIYWASSLERWAISLDVAVLCAADEKLLLLNLRGTALG